LKSKKKKRSEGRKKKHNDIQIKSILDSNNILERQICLKRGHNFTNPITLGKPPYATHRCMGKTIDFNNLLTTKKSTIYIA